jgi:hypothetical protein
MSSNSTSEDNNLNKSSTWDLISLDQKNSIESHISKLESHISELESKLDRQNEYIISILLENRKLYTDSIKQNNELSKHVVTILEENRRIYLNAFNEVEIKEEENLKMLKPILEDVTRQNELLTKNITSPFLRDRLNYRYWRSNAFPGGDPDVSKGIAGIINDSPILKKFANIQSKSSDNDSDKVVKRRV